jgi:hypothetical protein
VRLQVEAEVLRIDDVEWTPSPCGALLDPDLDSVCTPVDSCPTVANPGQADADGDGSGDACDSPCADGLDNDGDGLVDFPDDPGCASPRWIEDPQCDDRVDNDGDGAVDWGGGMPPGEPDTDCVGAPWRDGERGRGARCGLGFELSLGMMLLARLRRRRAGTWLPGGADQVVSSASTSSSSTTRP